MDTRTRLTESALDIALEVGWSNITRDAVAARAGVAQGTLNWWFGSIDKLRGIVMAEAVRRSEYADSDGDRYLPIVAQGLATGDAAARGAPEAVRAAALAVLAG